MANNNLKTALRLMEQYGIQNIQVIQGTNPKQCIGIMYNGQRISTSAWVGHDFEAFFSEVKTGSCSVESVAKQKVSEAWGFTEEARQAHRDEQERTYADNINHLIQLKGRKISDVFNDYMHYQEMNNLLEYKQWIETVKAWYTEPETDFNGNIISQVSIEKGLARAKEFVLNALKNKDLYIINGYVYSNYGLTQLVKNWYGENDIKTTNENNQKIVNKFIELVS